MKKTLLIIFLCVIILGSGLVIFLVNKNQIFAPTPKPIRTINRTMPRSQKAAFVEEKIDTTNWRAYKDPAYGFEFKYPPEWGKTIRNVAVINDTTIEEFNSPNSDIAMASNDFRSLLKNHIDKRTTVNFENEKLCNDVWCGLEITVTEYNDRNFIDFSCYEGSCDISNLLDEKKQVSAGNDLIGNLEGKITNGFFPPAGTDQVFYSVFTPKFRFWLESSYYLDSEFTTGRNNGTNHFLNQLKKMVETIKFSK
jgi:hypothetical protein